jgi:selenocysteine-specific elongation factor
VILPQLVILAPRFPRARILRFAPLATVASMHVIGTAGHVDHGKSTLVQRLTGIDPDRFAEEKRRGLTIDLGFAWLTLPSGNEIGIVDVPGHERFIKNMLAGAGGISVCLFVVAANEGWMPQSAEHLAILDILGVSAGVVALTKIDTVDEETVELAEAEIDDELRRSSLAGAPIVPVSAVTGAGVDRLVEALDAAVGRAPIVPDLGRPRLWVDRVFSISGAGTVVTGTLAGGKLAAGEEVEIAPEARRARVRTIQNHKREVSEIGPGNRVALNLAGLERRGAERGDAIVRAGQWEPTTTIDVRLNVLPQWATKRRHELTEKGAHLFYAGSAETPVRIKLLGTDVVASGDGSFAQLYLREPLPLARGDRFVLRDAGRVLTFGGGVVLDPRPAPAGRFERGHLELLTRLEDAAPDEALIALVEAEGELGVSDATLRAGVAEPTEGLARMGDLLFSNARLKELTDTARAALQQHHDQKPLERGMPREALRTSLQLELSTFDALIESMDDLVEESAVIRRAAHEVTMSPEQQRHRDELLEKIAAGGFTPPLTKDLEADSALLRALTDSGELVRVGDFHITAQRAEEARAEVRARIRKHGPVTVAAIRDLLGTSRKYAVPLSEWLDETGATLRRGDERVLGPRE